MALRDILLIGAVVVSLPICLFRPVFGIFVWTILGFLNPQAFTFGMARGAPLAQAVAIPTIAGFIFSGRYKSVFCGEMYLLAILWGWFTLTTVNSMETPALAEKAADAWFRWGFVSKILLMTLVTVGIVNTRAGLRWLLVAVGGSFGLLVVHTLPGMIVSGGNFRVYGPENSMIADNTAFGLALDMALPFFLYLAKTESNRYMKWFMWVSFIGCIPAIFFTYSRGAFLGLVALGVCMFLQSKQKLLLVPVVMLALVFGAFVAPQKWRDRISESTDTQESSAASRLNAWTFCWNLAKAYPIMGGGFEPYTPFLFAQYAPNPKDVHAAHSIYFGVLVEHGFVGFFLYFTLVGYCLFTLRRIAKQAELQGDEHGAHYAHMLQFSLISFLASGAFLGRTYFDFYFMIVACTAIVHRVCREDWRAGSLEAEYDEESCEDATPLPDLAGA